MKRIESYNVLQLFIFCSMLFVVCIFFLYHAGISLVSIQSFECAISLVLLFAISILLGVWKHKFSAQSNQQHIRNSLYIGFLWTLEIGMNNIIQPGLPLRDVLDDIFWAIIAVAIFIETLSAVWKSGKIADGLKAGFWAGVASGAVACITALTVIVFGMNLLLSDKVNIEEWHARGPGVAGKMSQYFAYETLAGAMMHLIVLGAIMGVLLGLLGSLAGKLYFFFIHRAQKTT